MIASNATIETQHGCAPTYILHAHQVHVLHGKINWTHGKLNEYYRKIDEHFG